MQLNNKIKRDIVDVDGRATPMPSFTVIWNRNHGLAQTAIILVHNQLLIYICERIFLKNTWNSWMLSQQFTYLIICLCSFPRQELQLKHTLWISNKVAMETESFLCQFCTLSLLVWASWLFHWNQSTMTTEYEFSMYTIAYYKVSLQNYFIGSILFYAFIRLLNIICFKNIIDIDSDFGLGDISQFMLYLFV